ncbi:hypothetical protein L2E82_27995 [Cichorium intybus]|uniref:Uncharacterized protein n=1 Tax=Cichorium intybus TaxID=13427 RepID=A0ACB9CUJ9_CICIN|nr:hypothetical protein L2E82_27995 [Cichorium intybus]
MGVNNVSLKTIADSRQGLVLEFSKFSISPPLFSDSHFPSTVQFNGDHLFAPSTVRFEGSNSSPTLGLQVNTFVAPLIPDNFWFFA